MKNDEPAHERLLDMLSYWAKQADICNQTLNAHIAAELYQEAGQLIEVHGNGLYICPSSEVIEKFIIQKIIPFIMGRLPIQMME